MSFGISAGTLLSVGGSLAGGLMASGAASDALASQEAGAARSDATERYMYDTTREDNAPFRDAGVAATNRLSYLMGLGGSAGGAAQTRDQIRAGLLDQYTTAATPSRLGSMWNGGGGDAAEAQAGNMYIPGTVGGVDEVGLSAAIDKRMAEQAAAQATQAAQGADPAYGSLMRKFGASDLAGDTVYQSGLKFGLDEGVKGINRQAAAGGSMLSGATLKALTRFGNDYGSTKANESYNRFNTDQNSQYNKLAGLSGAGQQSTNQVSAAGANMANSISQSQQGVGNARASSYLTQGNAWQNALNGGVSAFRNGGTNSLASWGVPSNADAFIPMQAGGGY